MVALICFVLAVLDSPFKSNSRLEAENAVLRHQLIVLQRKVRGRAQLTNNDRWFFVRMYRWFPSILKVVTIVQPETLVSWHRAGFCRYWFWKSSSRGGRPQIETELRALIRQTGVENQLWGAPRIHGELARFTEEREIHQYDVADQLLFAVDREAKRNPETNRIHFPAFSAKPEIAAMPRWRDGHRN